MRSIDRVLAKTVTFRVLDFPESLENPEALVFEIKTLEQSNLEGCFLNFSFSR